MLISDVPLVVGKKYDFVKLFENHIGLQLFIFYGIIQNEGLVAKIFSQFCNNLIDFL